VALVGCAKITRIVLGGSRADVSAAELVYRAHSVIFVTGITRHRCQKGIAVSSTGIKEP
jgi:hypothetical protein